jgi:hypothetical protein
MDGLNTGYLELLNLTEIQADVLNTPYVTCDTLTASVGNITTGNITTINSTDVNTTNASIPNLNFTTATGTNANITNLRFTTATGPTGYITNMISSNTTSTNLNFTTATGTNFNSTNATIPNLNFTTASGPSGYIGNLRVNSLETSSALSAVNFNCGGVTEGYYDALGFFIDTLRINTSITGPTGFITNMISTNTTSTNLSFTNATGTNGNIQNLTIPTLTGSRIVLSDANDKLVSSSFRDTDLAPKASPTFTGQITIPPGSAGTPSIAILGDLNSGIYSQADDNIDISTGGGIRLNVSNFGLLCQDIRVNSGIDGYLTYFQPSTKYLSSYDPMGLPVSTATSTQLGFKANIASPAFTGQITIPLGSVLTPSLSFTGDLNTGFFSASPDTINLVSNATTRLSISNSGVNVPNLSASKIVLSDASDNLVSSVYTDTDLLNNWRIETYPRAITSILLTYTDQRGYYVPVIVHKTMTFSSISFGLQIPAGATISAPYMGEVALAIYNSTSQTSTNAYLTSSIPNAKVSGTDSGVLPVVLTNTPSTKCANTYYTYTFASPVSLTAGQYFLAGLFQNSSYSSGGVISASVGVATSTINITSLPNGILIGQGATISGDFTITPTATFTASMLGTSLNVSVAPTQYNLYIGAYIQGTGVAAGTRITGGTGSPWTININQTLTSRAMTSSTASLVSSANTNFTILTGLATGRTGNYTMNGSSQFTTGTTATTTALTLSYGATANPFTLLNYNNSALSTANYGFEQSSITTLPASPTLSSSNNFPYLHIST